MLQNYKFKSKTLLLIFILFSLLFSITYANGAKPRQDPSGNGGMIFDENPGVALLNETITFNLKDSTYITQALVTVVYEMKNLLDQDQGFNMFFVIPPSNGYETAVPFSVVLDGTNITHTSNYGSMDMPNNWKPNVPQGFIEPYSKERYDTHFEGDFSMILESNRNKLAGINIPIKVKANSNVKLLIQYPCKGGFSNMPEFHNSIYNYMYYLTPARFWNQEPQVTLNVALPDTSSYAFHSSIPMENTAPNTYTAKLDSLPDSEWVFSFVDQKGIMYGTNSSNKRTLITFYISITIFLMALLASWMLKSRIYIKLGYILSVAYFYWFKGNITDGYIGEFVVMIPVSIALILIIPMAYSSYYKRKAAKGNQKDV